MKIQFEGEQGYHYVIVDGVTVGNLTKDDKGYMVYLGTGVCAQEFVARLKYGAGRLASVKRWTKAAIQKAGSLEAVLETLKAHRAAYDAAPTSEAKLAMKDPFPMPLARRSAKKTAEHVRTQRAWADRVARASGNLEASVFYGMETQCQFYAIGPIEVLEDALKIGDLEISWASVQSLWAHHSVKVGW